jgi:hypothetical protein
MGNRRTIVALEYAVKPLFKGVHSSQRDNFYRISKSIKNPQKPSVFGGFLMFSMCSKIVKKCPKFYLIEPLQNHYRTIYVDFMCCVLRKTMLKSLKT